MIGFEQQRSNCKRIFVNCKGRVVVQCVREFGRLRVHVRNPFTIATRVEKFVSFQRRIETEQQLQSQTRAHSTELRRAFYTEITRNPRGDTIQTANTTNRQVVARALSRAAQLRVRTADATRSERMRPHRLPHRLVAVAQTQQESAHSAEARPQSPGAQCEHEGPSASWAA